VLDFGKHKEACSYRLEDTDVFDGLAYAKKKKGIFVIVTHLHFYTDEKKKRLLEVIEKARENGAEFVAPSVLFS
jgi:spermidine synthase